MDVLMSDTDVNRPISDARRKRINRLKKIIIACVLVWMLLPVILCTVLFVQMKRMEQRVDCLTEQLGQSTGENVDREIAGVISAKPDGAEHQSETVPVSAVPEGTDAPGEDSVQTETVQEELPERTGETAGEIPDGSCGTGVNETGVRHVYLTFDDGPSIYTDDILDILAQYEIKATFFVLPKEGFDAQYKRIVEEGHTLGMHSYTHVYKEIYADLDAFMQDVTAIQNYLYEKTGVLTNVYRFPGGSSNAYCRNSIRPYLQYLQDRGIQYYDWNISSGDASGPVLTQDEVTDNVLRNLERYDECMILMHDAQSKRSTVDALPKIIESILALENTVILPITEDSVPIQHRTLK